VKVKRSMDEEGTAVVVAVAVVAVVVV